MFVKADTGLLPFEEATALVTGGIFRFTRNPMYLGMFMMVFGAGFLMGSVGALIPLLIFMLIIRFNFVAGEEHFMEAAFGQQYLDYKSKVRRWI
jgi:protein-S-isoprenylcysteine O-methyltransferase Ste14